MKLLIIIDIIFLVACSSPRRLHDNSDTEYIIQPGKGTNQLHIETSKITSVFSLLGKNESLGEKYSCGFDTTFIAYSYEYRTLGLTIISSLIPESKGEDLAHSRVEHIYFSSPAKAKTSNGIVLNKSTLEEIQKEFGEPDKQDGYADVTILHYNRKGISFIVDKATNSLTGIEVYKENGYSSQL